MGFRSLEAGEVYLEHNEYALTLPLQEWGYTFLSRVPGNPVGYVVDVPYSEYAWLVSGEKLYIDTVMGGEARAVVLFFTA